MNECSVPATPLPVSTTHNGWIPEVALHRRGRMFVLESSYGASVLLGLMFSLAFVVSIFLWDEQPFYVPELKMKHVALILMSIAGASMGAMVLARFAVRNHFNQRMIVDPDAQTVTVQKSRAEAVLHWLVLHLARIERQPNRKPVLASQTEPETEIVLNWSDIVGIQICGGPPHAYQTNLVFRTPSGEVDRDCLTNHTIKRYCTSIAHEYANRFGFRIIDDIGASATGYSPRSLN